MKIKTVLVAGGAGYIGSHTCIELIKAGYEVVCADSLENSSVTAVRMVEQIVGKSIPLHVVDFCDKGEIVALLESNPVDAAIHFAGYKAVNESIHEPIKYYDNNLQSVLNLCSSLADSGCCNIVFSSSATVYGVNNKSPMIEDYPTSAINPYGRTKLYAEEILKDLHIAEPAWNVSILRYFNPVGAHPSGLIGEDPSGLPTNLMPIVTRVAAGKQEQLSIFGNDYNTPDGTGVRDFIHVVDLARGHVAALKKLEEGPGYIVHNLGTGEGYSVLELVKAFERVNGVKVPYQFAPRRSGDVAVCFADTGKAKEELGWSAELSLEDMVRDSWNWQVKNPDGYVE